MLPHFHYAVVNILGVASPGRVVQRPCREIGVAVRLKCFCTDRIHGALSPGASQEVSLHLLVIVWHSSLPARLRSVEPKHDSLNRGRVSGDVSEI